MKRFTETTKWTGNKWFRRLPAEYKLLWLYLLDSCDCAGVWEVDLELAGFLLGSEYTYDDMMEHFSARLEPIGEEKIFIRKFIEFQYGVLTEKCPPHRTVIATLTKHNIPYSKTPENTILIQPTPHGNGYPNRYPKEYPNVRVQVRAQEKEKEKEKDKEKERDKPRVPVRNINEQHSIINKEDKKPSKTTKPRKKAARHVANDPPDYETVRSFMIEYAKQKEWSVIDMCGDYAEQFLDHYTSCNWTQKGGQIITDWKAAARKSLRMYKDNPRNNDTGRGGAPPEDPRKRIQRIQKENEARRAAEPWKDGLTDDQKERRGNMHSLAEIIQKKLGAPPTTGPKAGTPRQA